MMVNCTNFFRLQQHIMKYVKVFFLTLVGLFGVKDIYGYHLKGDLSASLQDSSAFTLANILQSHMVIQQTKPSKLWGTAPAGSKIHLQADWLKEAVIAQTDANGKWVGKLSVPKATPGNFESHSLSIIHAEDTVALTDILIGEVWLCSGQSNMQMEMQPDLPVLEGVIDYEKEIASANCPHIRFINIRQGFSRTPVESVEGDWQVVSPETAGKLSGVAYYFGREILENVQVPVGLVVSAFGGSAAQAWTSREVLAADSVLKDRYLDPYDNSTQPTECLDSIQGLEKLLEVLARPSLLYNAMIYPLTHLSIRGFIWYQGESNRFDGDVYDRLSAEMIKGWRKDFNQGELPFYYVQMTPFNWFENDPTAFYYARLREAQERVMQLVGNTGMAVTMDIGEVDNIHPRNKKDVGIRLAKIALYHTYGQKDTVYLGPKFSKFRIKGDKVKVAFEPKSIGSGLCTTDQQPPKHFYIAGDDKVFHPAKARIVNNEVWLESSKVKEPVAVRYAFTNYPVTNFCNKEELPAMPFRTDKWDD